MKQTKQENAATQSLPETADGIREVVQGYYGAVAEEGLGGFSDPEAFAGAIGYQPDEIEAAPAEANLGLGCGNPTALAELGEGEVVVDLGAGGGFDALIAARKVGPTGRVIGVDMTPAMLERARRNAVELGVAKYVEFREGLIEALPVVSGSADVVISNCVINLSTDKDAVFQEAFRVLKPGGRLAVSDIVLSEALPEDLKGLATAYAGCVGGALLEDDYLGKIRAAGFEDVTWERTSAAPLLDAADPLVAQVMEAVGRERLEALAGSVWSYRIRARKP